MKKMLAPKMLRNLKLLHTLSPLEARYSQGLLSANNKRQKIFVLDYLITAPGGAVLLTHDGERSLWRLPHAEVADLINHADYSTPLYLDAQLQTDTHGTTAHETMLYIMTVHATLPDTTAVATLRWFTSAELEAMPSYERDAKISLVLTRALASPAA